MAQADVSTPAAEYTQRLERWKQHRALLKGTRAMRAAGKDYLPKFEQEEEMAWKRRINATVLYSGFATIVRTMAGLPFARPITFGDDVPTELRGQPGADGREIGGWIEDIDLKGNHVNIFAKRVFASGLAMGSGLILVDMPREAPSTAADDLRRRPRWVHLQPEQLIDARRGIVGGRERFVHVRIRETVRAVEGYRESFVEQIREIEPGQWRLHRRGQDGKWAVVADGAYDLPFVALAPFLAGQDRAEFTADSPLENCSDLNVTHWQSSSDQRNILTFSRFAMLVVKGASARDQIALGPMTLLSVDEGGDAKIIEHTGAAIEAGERDLKKLEEQMDAEGLKLLVRRPGTVTATEMVIDEAKDQSELEALAAEFGDTLELACEYTAAWMGESDGGSVTVSQDFGVVANAPAIQQAVLKLRELGDLGGEDTLRELQRAGLLSDALNVDEALERAAADTARTIAAVAGGGRTDGDPADG